MTDLRRFFGGAYVLNLDTRPDRLADFNRRLEEAGLTGVTRYRAIEGDKCPHPAWWRAGNGAWGCMMSHARLCQDALLDGLSSYLVFEDDVVFTPDFAERLTWIMNRLIGVEWDQLYLGGQHLHVEAGPPWPFRKEIVRCRNVNRTHAFAVNARFMVKFQQHVLHAPDYIGAAFDMHIDHQLGLLHERREDRILAANPWLCGQAAGSSNITGTEKPEEFWNSTGWGE